MPLGRLFGSAEFLGGCLGAGAAGVLLGTTNLVTRVAVVGDVLVLLGPLLGIVFAGFTLVVSLLSDDYLRWLNTSPDGPRGFLAPFVIAVGVQVFTLLLAIVYRAIATDLSSSYEKTLFVLIGFLTTFAALEVVALARNVFAHGLTRARGIEVSDLQDKRAQRASKG